MTARRAAARDRHTARERLAAAARAGAGRLATVLSRVGRSLLDAAVTAFAAPPPPRARPRRGRRGRTGRDRLWLLDAALGLALVLVTSASLSVEGSTVGPRTALAAAIAVGLPVAVRDRWPLAAWRAMLAVALVSAGVLAPVLPGAPLLATHLIAVLVTSYSAVIRAERPIALGAWILTMLGIALLPVPAQAGAAAFSPEGWVALVAVTSAPIVLAHNVRARRGSQEALRDERRRGEVVRAEAAVLAERARIARELHDVVAHHMTVIAIQAEAAPLRSPDDASALRDDLAVIRGTALAALTETRRILGVLRADGPGGVEPPAPGLGELDGLAAATREAGHAVELDLAVDDADVSPGVALSVHRIVQESLSNVLRHAPGAAVAVVVRWADPRREVLEVRVENGPPVEGNRPSADVGGGHGTVGMRERVTMLDGRLDTGPTVDGGYAVVVRLPVTAR